MKKGMFILLLTALIGCEIFLLEAHKDHIALEKEANEGYTRYAEDKSEYTVTKGTITDIPEMPFDSMRYCFIEYTTSEGKKVTDQFFPLDTDSDKLGNEVDIAYKLIPAGTKMRSEAARTEYIPNTIPLRRNRLLRIVFAAAIGIMAARAIVSAKK
ncbi:MAG: hypothetical protein K6B74_10335 [Ruminococcus sp.]|nr:hypothetical protein [Ruminococcus sp.]